MTRRSVACVAVALACGSAAAGAQAAFTYHNARFGFSVDVPAGFVPTRPADNGDGRTFVEANGDAVLSAWASYNASSDTLSHRMDEDVADCAGHKAIYLTVHPDWAVMSCMSRTGRIIYQKTTLRGTAESGVFTSVRLAYSAKPQAKWDRVAVATARSLQPAVAQ